MSNRIEDLSDAIINRARKAIAEMNQSQELRALGVQKVYVNETRRSLVTQMAYYSRGRMDPQDVRKMYTAAGLYNLTEDECKTKITWTLQSKHIEGNAIDIVPVKDGKIWWNAPDEVWNIMGKIGIECGLRWGGSWEMTPDKPHYEI